MRPSLLGGRFNSLETRRWLRVLVFSIWPASGFPVTIAPEALGGSHLWQRDNTEDPSQSKDTNFTTSIMDSDEIVPDIPFNAHRKSALNQPINIAFITLGVFAGIALFGYIIFRIYAYWVRNRKPDPDERLWPPINAPTDEIAQLVELIRVGMIDSHGAPPYVINWVVHGVNAPWPPAEGVEELMRWRRRRRRRRGAGTGSRSRTRLGHEAGGRTRRRARAAGAVPPTVEVDPLPPYVPEAAYDANHYPLPPPPPPDIQDPPHTPPPEFSSEIMANNDAMSEVGSGHSHGSRPISGASDIPEEDLYLTGLSPRPAAPVDMRSTMSGDFTQYYLHTSTEQRADTDVP